MALRQDARQRACAHADDFHAIEATLSEIIENIRDVERALLAARELRGGLAGADGRALAAMVDHLERQVSELAGRCAVVTTLAHRLTRDRVGR